MILSYEDEGPYVEEVRIGELKFFVGQKILYIFDYGTEWRFLVDVEVIRTAGAQPREPKIIKVKGEAPAQYGPLE